MLQSERGYSRRHSASVTSCVACSGVSEPEPRSALNRRPRPHFVSAPRNPPWGKVGEWGRAIYRPVGTGEAMRFTTLEAHLDMLRNLYPRRRKKPKKPARSASVLQSQLMFQPQLQHLEDRTVLDGTVRLSQGLLSITGTTGNDTVTVGQTAGKPSQPDQVVVTLNGQAFGFKVSLVNQIQA